MALENRSPPKLPGRWFPLFLDGAYLAGAALAAPLFAVRGKLGHAWESVRRRSGAVETPPSEGPTLWLHAVSVGEILSARRFVARFSEVHPDWTLVLSASTRTGLETARRAYPGKTVVSFPLDLSRFVRRAFERVRPDLVAIVEHDLWPNFFWRAARLDVPIAIVNARISEASFQGYRKIAPVFRGLLGTIAVACAQDEATAARLRALGVPADRVRVTGNVKFDNVPEREPGVRGRLGISPEEWVLVGASTHPGEEAILLGVFEGLRADAAPGGAPRLVLVPRRPERAEEVLRLLAERGHRAVRWSDLRGGGKPPEGSPVILVDTVGDLDRISSAADLVFVGGSLVPFGGHNVMAPAGMGLPVAIGPHHESFASDVAAFAEREAIAVVRDAEDLARVAREFRANPERARGLAERARGLVRELGGASDRALEALGPLLRSLESRRREKPPR